LFHGGSADSFDAAQAARGERLACAQRARALASRLTAVAGLLLAKAEATQESMSAAGTPTSSWLTVKGGLSKREAASFLHQAQELAAHPDVAGAATAGRISVNQARVIGTVLGGLTELDETQQARAEQLLLDLAGHLDSDRLAKATPQVLAQVAPQQADETLERRLQRQAEAAQRNRSLVFRRDGNGSILVTGSLPMVDGEAWIAQLDAYTESRRRTAVEERDPLAAGLTPEQRRADALIAMILNHSTGRRAPKVGGDRPRIVVTVDYAKLVADATAAGLIGDGEPLSAGDLRRLCCDADLLPAVLGGPSTVLDVGRDHRLDLRAALVLRDGGCVFPGWHARPTECEAHHSVVERRPYRPFEPVPSLPPPPCVARTSEVRHQRPVGGTDRRGRHPRSHPTPKMRSGTKTHPPRPVRSEGVGEERVTGGAPLRQAQGTRHQGVSAALRDAASFLSTSSGTITSPSRVAGGPANAYPAPRTSRSFAANSAGLPAYGPSPPLNPPWWLGNMARSVPSIPATSAAARPGTWLRDSVPAAITTLVGAALRASGWSWYSITGSETPDSSTSSRPPSSSVGSPNMAGFGAG